MSDRKNPTEGPSGVFCAALTPFRDDLSADVDAYLDHCRWLVAEGCDGIAALGTTGEANSLSLDERLALVEALAEAGFTGDRLIAGTGACALPDAVALTRRALTLDSPNVLVLPPFYYKNPSEDGLYAYYAELIERVADPHLRVYLYHIPQTSAVAVPHKLILRLCEAYGPVIAGAKDSSGDFANMRAMIDLVPGFRVFSGSETLLLPVLEAGGVGCITAGSNLAAAATAKLYRLWYAEGASADTKAAQEDVTRKRQALDGAPMIPAMKAILALGRREPEWRNVRPPFVPLNDTEIQAAATRAAAAGLPYAGPASAQETAALGTDA